MYTSSFKRKSVAQGKQYTELRIFDTVTEFVDHATNGKTACKRFENVDVQRERFLGRRFADWTSVRDAAKSEWADGLATLDRFLADLVDSDIPSPVSRKRRMRYDETNGDEIDYDRLRSGQDFWRTTQRQNTHGPATITILVDICANGGMTAEALGWRGAAAVALTDILESAGYRVALWAIDTTERAHTDQTGRMVACQLKDYSDPMDRSTLVNSTSAWFFRSVFFGEACHSHEGRQGASGLGQHRIPREDDLDQVTQDEKRVVIKDAYSYSDALQAVKGALVKLLER